MTNTRDNKALHSFLWAFFLAIIIFLPIIIYNRGIFIYMGDYNVQQIPFYKLAHEACRSGNIFWNWNTDLGADFIGSYSFYLLFSPFFWLTLLFPTDFLPYLMGPLLILKTAFAAFTSYFYIKRFVKNFNYAILGSILYAFSGFMTFNIFFNHFHDVVVFFPLLLVSLEELVQNNRHGFFAVMVAVSAVVNYWFFIGEVVFTVIYVFVRMSTDKNWRSLKKFVSIAFEALLGVGMATAVLLPSALAIMGNPRTTKDELIKGQLMWIYGFPQRLPAIIESFFFPPEIPSRHTFFPKMGAKWSSLSAWIPLFSTVGTIAYCKSKNRDFVKRIIVISMIMSLVPVFNSAFVLFNDSYYARWFYMPILFLAIATVSALEIRNEIMPAFKTGFLWTGGFITVFIIAIGLSPAKNGDGGIKIGLFSDATSFWSYSLVAVICLTLCCMLIYVFNESDGFLEIASIMLSVVIVFFSLGYLISGKSSREKDNHYIDTLLNGKDKISLPNDEFCRSDFYKCSENLGMMWGLPTIQAFHSIIPPSVMEFYHYVEIKRDVSSKPPVTYDGLRSLLSVRWLFIDEDQEEQKPMEGYSFAYNQNGYNIYENDNYIPMGFCYERAISNNHLEDMNGEQKVRYMLSSLVLEDDALERNSDILEITDKSDFNFLNNKNMKNEIKRRKSDTADYFKIDNRGFETKINSQKETMMFFSVPYDKGWNATVNGKTTFIEKANIGFMAVRIPEGESIIRFNYVTPGIILGLNITAVSIILLIVYLICMFKMEQTKPKQEKPLEIKKIKGVTFEETLKSIDKIEDFSKDIEIEEIDLITPENIKKKKHD